MVNVRFVLLLFLGICLLVGCTSAQPENTSSTMTAGNEYLVYTRSGGIMGKTSTWTIYKNGRISSDQTTQYQTTPEETAALFSQITLPVFIEQSKAAPDQHCADCTTAVLNYHSGDQDYELKFVVETADPASPASIWVTAIEALLAKSAR
jgi:hypothetical protein